MLQTQGTQTHKHKDILWQLMFIKQPAEMKPIRLCSHEKHSHPGDCHTHTHTPGCINIIAARQALFPVSSFLPGLQINLGSERSEILHTHTAHIDIPAGKIGFTATDKDLNNVPVSGWEIMGPNRYKKHTEQFIAMVTNPTAGKKVTTAINFKWHRCKVYKGISINKLTRPVLKPKPVSVTWGSIHLQELQMNFSWRCGLYKQESDGID